jgi:hypothetical protein
LIRAWVKGETTSAQSCFCFKCCRERNA